MKKIILIPCLLVFTIITSTSNAQEKKLLRKAALETQHLHYLKAVALYDEALKLNPNSYLANLGKGMVLSEFLERYEQAIPFLEKALQESPKDTMLRINNSLGKSYLYVGNYPKALVNFGKVARRGKANNPDYDVFLDKRIDNCRYAMAHSTIAPATEQTITNIGMPVNSIMAEYCSVIVGNDIIFTSERKDDVKEERNGENGKYFESMYKATLVNGKYTTPERYILPDIGKQKNYLEHNESVVSVSKDGKTLFVFRDGKILETQLNIDSKEVNELDKNINIAKYQTHATLNADGNELYFASQGTSGSGGTDLYYSLRDNDGNWSAPIILPLIINTYFDEDAPFMSCDGTLYFSSNGHPGYGGFDVYKTHLVNGIWTTPENLGQPINSSGDDLYFSLNNNSSYGYYSSSRVGGQGDMDIYKVHYLSNEIPECNTPNLPSLTINATPNELNKQNYMITSEVPKGYAQYVRGYSWKINDSAIAPTSSKFEYTFNKPGVYTIALKVMASRDTCPTPLAFCNSQTITVGENLSAIINVVKEVKTEDTNLKNMNWKLNTIYFEFDKYTLIDKAVEILDVNIQELKTNKSATFTISGFADSRGSDDYNKNLSAQRANAVKKYLIKKGIAPGRVKAVNAMGETEPVNNCTNDVVCSDDQYLMNRRVEFKVVNKNTNEKPVTGVSTK